MRAGWVGFSFWDRFSTVEVQNRSQIAEGRRPSQEVRLAWGRGEEGQMAGIEALPFGLLIFVIGVLLVANVWAVIDAKIAVSAAAREATRAYVEAPPGSDPMALARSAAAEAMLATGRNPERLVLEPLDAGFSRCHAVRFQASYPVPALTLPWIGGFGEGFTARASHREDVDPYRSGVPRATERC